MHMKPSMPATLGPAARAGEWLAAVAFNGLPSSVVAATRSSLIDWFACAIAGLDEPVTRLVSERMLRYAPSGPAALMTGGSTAAPMAAEIERHGDVSVPHPGKSRPLLATCSVLAAATLDTDAMATASALRTSFMGSLL